MSDYIKLSTIYRDLRWNGYISRDTLAILQRDLYDKMSKIQKGASK